MLGVTTPSVWEGWGFCGQKGNPLGTALPFVSASFLTVIYKPSEAPVHSCQLQKQPELHLHHVCPLCLSSELRGAQRGPTRFISNITHSEPLLCSMQPASSSGTGLGLLEGQENFFSFFYAPANGLPSHKSAAFGVFYRG